MQKFTIADRELGQYTTDEDLAQASAENAKEAVDKYLRRSNRRLKLERCKSFGSDCAFVVFKSAFDELSCRGNLVGFKIVN